MDAATLLRTFAILVVFFAVLLAAAYWVRRWALGARQGGVLPLRILARMPLPPKAVLYVVQLGENVFVLGVTEHNVSLLQQYSVEEWQQTFGPEEGGASALGLFTATRLPRK